MSRDGNGNASIPNPTFINGALADADQVNANNGSITADLTNSIAADGQTTPTANLKMGGFKHINVGAGSASLDSVNLGQVQAGAFRRVGVAGGTKNALTISPSPAITAYATGQRFTVTIGATSSDDTTTINVSSIGIKAVEIDNAALSATSFLVANKTYDFEYDGTAFQATKLSVPSISTATTTTEGITELATQAEVDAGTETNKIVTPETLAAYKGVAKAWLVCDTSGVVVGSYNITSVSDDGTGIGTVTLDTDFANTGYTVVSSVETNAGMKTMSIRTITAGTFQFYASSNGSDTPSDAFRYHFACFGDQ